LIAKESVVKIKDKSVSTIRTYSFTCIATIFICSEYDCWR